MAVAIAAAFSALFSVTSASAVTLKGLWAPITRCPVDDPSMLANSSNEATGEGTFAGCFAFEAQKTSLKLGGLALSVGPVNSQMGLIGNGVFPFWPTVLPKDGRGIVASPQVVPGGLIGLACGQPHLAGDVCTSPRPERLNRVTSTLESAGAPSNFSALGAASPGPLVVLPVKVHLQNPLLGPNCYIGSNAHPVVLQPRLIQEPQASVTQFNAEGVEESGALMLDISLKRATQADITFAVGTATGCGWKGRLNDAINRTVGLPSPAGANSVVWKDVSSYVIVLSHATATDGADLSKYWHEAVIG